VLAIAFVTAVLATVASWLAGLNVLVWFGALFALTTTSLTWLVRRHARRRVIS